MRRFQFYAEYEADIEPDEMYVIRQYQAVAGAFDQLWKEISLRTNKGEWREDGVGSCRIDKPLSEDLLDGPVSLKIIGLRERKDHETTGWTGHACPYHRPGQGCILGNLKSPRCLDHHDYQHDEEIEERFGLCIMDMRAPLARILMGGWNPKTTVAELKPQVNDELVKTMVAGTQAVIDHIKTFPILHPEEAEQK